LRNLGVFGGQYIENQANSILQTLHYSLKPQKLIENNKKLKMRLLIFKINRSKDVVRQICVIKLKFGPKVNLEVKFFYD